MTALYTFTQVSRPDPPQIENLDLIRGDAYDDVANPKLSWTILGETIDPTETVQAVLCVREQNDTDLTQGTELLLIDNSSEGDTLGFELTSSDTNLMFTNGRTSIFNYDVQVDFDGTGAYETLVRGTITVTLAETRR